MQTPSLANRRPLALVTGASSGIGLALARVLAAHGHDLVLAARNLPALQRLAGELQAAHGVRATAIASDLARRDGADTLVAALAEAALEVDVLVNNAGFGVFGAHVETSIDDEQRMLDVNVVALTRLTKLLAPAMVHRGAGRILQVASTAAFQPGPYFAVYCAAKAYVLSYSVALAEELRGTGVTVTALCPGATESAFAERAGMIESGIFKARKLPTAAEVAAFGVRAMLRGQPIAIPGVMNRLLAESVRLLPRGLAARIAGKVLRPA